MTDKETEEKIQQLQLFEQSLSNLLAQRQQFQSQLVEVESALTEISSTPKAYKIVGNIMVEGQKDQMQEDLKSKKEIISIRVKNLEKQEENIREKAKKIQTEVFNEMKTGEKNG